MDGVVWTPSEDVLDRANVVRLMRRHGFSTYRELVARSIEDPEWFWPAAVEDTGIELYEPWSEVVDLSRGPEWATWFRGAKLNIAWNCVHRWRSDRTAAVFRGEDGARRELTFAQLSDAVTRLAERLVQLGVEPGDRVAIYLPMSPEAAIASHACAHIGAVQVPVFSGFAAPAVAQRLVDSGAKAAITARSSLRRGKTVPMLAILEEARRHVAGARARDRRAVGRRGRRLSRHARAARGRSRASLPAHVHVRDDRETQGGAPRPGRLPGLDRARGVLPGRRRPGRRRPLLHRHGLDHGALDRRRLRGDGREPRLRGGSARLAARPALAPRRGGARHHPRLLADAGARADPAGGAGGRTCRRCACS